MDESWTAQMDQLLASLRDISKAVSSYYRDLIAEGFSVEHAILLSAEMQSSIMRGQS